jgi:hypothetical protein
LAQVLKFVPSNFIFKFHFYILPKVLYLYLFWQSSFLNFAKIRLKILFLAKYKKIIKMKLAGRKVEIQLLESLLHKNEVSFVAIYGRRRIGKTYLVRQVYQKEIVFECSGLHQKSISQQLENFWLALQEVDKKGKATLPPKTWLQAFAQLKNYLHSLPETDKKVIFLDEISWFETSRGGFLAALDNFWNQFCSKRSDIVLVICGSAASWMIEKVINDTGGLHNRITHNIQLMPFTLGETKDFLALNHVQLALKDIAQLYMCIGGVPFYLKEIQAGQSVPQILDQLFFKEQAVLKREFQNLYAALFKNNTLHEKIVATLVSKAKGLTRNEIVQNLGASSSGGGLSVALQELIYCGFVKPIFPFGKSKGDCLYRLIDEYSLFYFKFLVNQEQNNSWLNMSNKPVYKIWSGYAFENLCFKHSFQIKKALGIHGIISNEYSWFLKGDTQNTGTQIDFIIDRDDNCMNILELKFHNAEFEIKKEYAKQLSEKINIFKEKTKTKKNIFLTLLTANGAKKNEHYLSIVTNQIALEDLFL